MACAATVFGYIIERFQKTDTAVVGTTEICCILFGRFLEVSLEDAVYLLAVFERVAAQGNQGIEALLGDLPGVSVVLRPLVERTTKAAPFKTAEGSGSDGDAAQEKKTLHNTHLRPVLLRTKIDIAK